MTPEERGPVICSRLPSSLKQRNALGAHSGSYSIYRALSIAMGALNPGHKPDYTMTEPPVNFPPQPAWFDPKKIVAFDPWGHLVQTVFKKEMDMGLDIRPSIAVTKAHLKMSELDEAARKGTFPIDGSIVMKSRPLKNEDGTVSSEDGGVEVYVSKAAVEPVWYLPGVAERFGMSAPSLQDFQRHPFRDRLTISIFSSESLLRRALFEDTGGMYPELITRPDIKVFLPPIGGLTVYVCKQLLDLRHFCLLIDLVVVGNPAYLSDESKELTLRVHDECK